MSYSYTDNMFFVSWETIRDFRTLFKEEEMVEGDDYETHLVVSGSMNEMGWFNTGILKIDHAETVFFEEGAYNSQAVLKISVLKETYNYLKIKYSWELDTFLARIHTTFQKKFLETHELGPVDMAILFNKSVNPLVEMDIRAVPEKVQNSYHRSLDFSNELERRLNYFLPTLVENHCWNSMFEMGDDDGWKREARRDIDHEAFWGEDVPQSKAVK